MGQLLEENRKRKKKVSRDGSKQVKKKKAKKHPDDRPGAIGSLFGRGEEA